MVVSELRRYTVRTPCCVLVSVSIWTSLLCPLHVRRLAGAHLSSLSSSFISTLVLFYRPGRLSTERENALH